MNKYVGKHCDAYNDGKASPSRLVRIEILDIVPRNELANKYWKMWRKALLEDIGDARSGVVSYVSNIGDETNQKFDWNCDTFIFGQILGDGETHKDPIMFAKRHKSEVWYGVNWNYELDLESSMRKKRIRKWKKCAKENGLIMKYNKKTELYDYFTKGGKKVGEV